MMFSYFLRSAEFPTNSCSPLCCVFPPSGLTVSIAASRKFHCHERERRGGAHCFHSLAPFFPFHSARRLISFGSLIFHCLFFAGKIPARARTNQFSKRENGAFPAVGAGAGRPYTNRAESTFFPPSSVRTICRRSIDSIRSTKTIRFVEIQICQKSRGIGCVIPRC